MKAQYTETHTIFYSLRALCSTFSMSEKKVSKKEKKAVSLALEALSDAAKGFYMQELPKEHRATLKGLLEEDGKVKLLAAEIINTKLKLYRRSVWIFDEKG